MRAGLAMLSRYLCECNLASDAVLLSRFYYSNKMPNMVKFEEKGLSWAWANNAERGVTSDCAILNFSTWLMILMFLSGTSMSYFVVYSPRHIVPAYSILCVLDWIKEYILIHRYFMNLHSKSHHIRTEVWLKWVRAIQEVAEILSCSHYSCRMYNSN